MADIYAAIGQYGIIPVIIGVILYIILKIQDNKYKKQRAAEDLAKESARMKEETEREDRIMTSMCELLKQVNAPVQHTIEEEENNRKLGNYISEQLSCMVEHGCARSFVMVFHNGITDLLGRGFAKMSMEYESIAPGHRPIMTSYINVPRMMFPVLYKNINDNGSYDIVHAEDIKISDPYTYQFLKEHEIDRALFRAIRRSDGLLIGFVGIEYNKHDDFDLSKAHQLIDKKTQRITGALLSNQSAQD